MSQNKQDLILTFEQKVIKKIEIIINNKITVFRAIKRNLPKSECTLRQRTTYCSKCHFPSICQILCNFDFVALMIFTSAFLPCAILGTLGSPKRPWRSILHHFHVTLWLTAYYFYIDPSLFFPPFTICHIDSCGTNYTILCGLRILPKKHRPHVISNFSQLSFWYLFFYYLFTTLIFPPQIIIEKWLSWFKVRKMTPNKKKVILVVINGTFLWD